MSSQSTYRRWRSRTFGELVGQDHVTRTLLNALKTGRVHHAYLFCGPRGTGKTSTARILAKAVNCLTTGGSGDPCNECRMCVAIGEGRALDVIEIDAASNRGIDEIRDLRDRAGYAPTEARRKVYIIDEAHMLTTAAANAFLKTLEEPPPSTIFILATTEPHLLPATITSRCQRFDFRRVPADAATARLRLICREDGIEADDEALELIVRAAEGSLRDAQNLLDQLVAFNGRTLTGQQVREGLGLVADERVPVLARQILQRDTAGALRTLHAATQAGVDVRQLRKELIELLRQRMLAKFGVGTAEDDDLPDVPPDEYVRVLKRLNQADLRGEQILALPLEIAIVELGIGAVEPTADPLAASPAERFTPAPPAGGAARRDRATPGRPSSSPPSRPTPDRAREGFAERASRLIRDARGEQGTPAEQPPVEAIANGTAAEPAQEPATQAETAASSEDPATAADQAASAQPVAPAPSVSLERIRNDWSQVLRTVHATDRRLEGLLHGCEPIGVDGQSVTLGFYYDYHLSKVSDAKYRRGVEDALQKVFGVQLQVRCVMTVRDREGRLRKVTQDPVVRTAVEELGAKLVDVE